MKRSNWRSTQRAQRQRCRPGHQPRRIKSLKTIAHGRVEGKHLQAGAANTDGPAHPGQHQSLEQKLGHDVAPRCSQGFAHADLTGALGNRNQHDVDDSHGAERECHDADSAEE